MGLAIPFIGTAAGSACVFFLRKELSVSLQRALTGFAAGVMVAASIWSLIVPAIEQSQALGQDRPRSPNKDILHGGESHTQCRQGDPFPALMAGTGTAALSALSAAAAPGANRVGSAGGSVSPFLFPVPHGSYN